MRPWGVRKKTLYGVENWIKILKGKKSFVVIYTVFDLIRYPVPGLSLYLQLKVDDFFCPISNYFKIIEYDRMDAPIVSGCLV